MIERCVTIQMVLLGAVIIATTADDAAGQSAGEAFAVLDGSCRWRALGASVTGCS